MPIKEKLYTVTQLKVLIIGEELLQRHGSMFKYLHTPLKSIHFTLLVHRLVVDINLAWLQSHLGNKWENTEFQFIAI